MKNSIKALLITGSIVTQSAYASPIAGLFNTGEGITVDQQTDTHYALSDQNGVSIFGGFGEAAVGNGFPVGSGVWIDDSATSHWLTPTANRTDVFDLTSPGTYVWTLSFDLSGFDPASASFSGHFSADNNAVALLNGNQIGTAWDFRGWYDFSSSTNQFVNGVNKIEFVVTNEQFDGFNPTGLRVEFTGSNVSAVPLPGAAWLFLSSMFGFLAIKRKKQAL